MSTTHFSGVSAMCLAPLIAKCCALSWLVQACSSVPPAAPRGVAPAPATSGPPPAVTSARAERERAYAFDDPTRDTDRDGLEDPDDPCPTEPGPPSHGPGVRGCPKAYLEPKGPSGGRLARLAPGSAALPNDVNSEGIERLAEQILKHDLCGLAVSYTLVEDATRLSDAERRLGIARVETLRQLLLKKGLPDARIRLAPNTYPRDFLERGEPPEQFRDGVVLFPQELTACSAPPSP